MAESGVRRNGGLLAGSHQCGGNCPRMSPGDFVRNILAEFYEAGVEDGLAEAKN